VPIGERGAVLESGERNAVLRHERRLRRGLGYGHTSAVCPPPLSPTRSAGA
jgi:hypothetical protein